MKLSHIFIIALALTICLTGCVKQKTSYIESENLSAVGQSETESDESVTVTETATKPTTASTWTAQPETPPNVTEMPTESPDQKFDIDYWVAYAKSYAQSVGLRLDSTATDCWDNPISANAQCKYLEWDIQNRLNRYARDDDIMSVWIWAEKIADKSYEIYIGYA